MTVSDLESRRLCRMKEKKSKRDRILEEVNEAKTHLTPREIAELTGINRSTVRNYLRRMVKKQLIKQPYPGSYASEIVYGMMRVPVRLQNVIVSVAAPWLGKMVKIADFDEFVEDVHLMLQFGRQRRKITIRVSCDAGFDQRTLMFALNRGYDLVEDLTGHVVEKVTVRTIEKHRHFHGVSLDSVVKCLTVKAFEDFLDRVYEKKDGSGVRVERKISRDMEVDELLQMLQKGAPAFETAYAVTELNQAIKKLVLVIKHLSMRQATLEDQQDSLTKSITELVDSLQKAMQPKEQTPQKQPIARDQVPFYS